MIFLIGRKKSLHQICDYMMIVHKHKKSVLAWLWSGILLILLMVLVGGITRLTGSGLSMVKWEVISGVIPPLSEHEWEQAFAEYQQFPEYQKLNYQMELEGFKEIFWWEYSHRLLGRFIGLVFLLPFLFFIFSESLSPKLIRRLLLVMLLGMGQGIMGWLMVKSGLQDNPHVSHYRLAMHLSLALLLMGTLLWLILQIKFQHQLKKPFSPNPQLRLSMLCLVFIFIQIILGAFVAGLKGGYAYNTYPLMNGHFLPPEAFSYSSHLLENGIFLQFIHRWFAWLVVGLIFLLWRKVKRSPLSADTSFYSNALLGVSLQQVTAGISTLVLGVPLVLGVIHQLLAFLLFGISLSLHFHLKYLPDYSTARANY